MIHRTRFNSQNIITGFFLLLLLFIQIILFIAIFFGAAEGVAVGIIRLRIHRKAKVVVVVVAQVSSITFPILIFKEFRLYMHTNKRFISRTQNTNKWHT